MDEAVIRKAYANNQKLVARANRIRNWELLKTKYFWIYILISLVLIAIVVLDVKTSTTAFSNVSKTFFNGSNYTKFQNELVSSPKLMASLVSASSLIDTALIFFLPAVFIGIFALFVELYLLPMLFKIPEKDELELTIKIAKRLSAEGYSDKKIKRLLGI